MRLTPGKAEIIGFFVADGSLQESHISFWGHITEDMSYYDTVLKPLFLKEFNFLARPHKKPSNSVYGFYVCNRRILDYFIKELRISPGNKTYVVRIPKIIMNSDKEAIWTSFIRGFADGDGNFNCGRYTGDAYRPILRVLHTRPRIQLRSVSKNLIADIAELLVRLDIKYTIHRTKARKESEHEAYTLQICRRESIEKWMEIINFNNPTQKTKYHIFKKHGFLPPYTTMVQRLSILKGETCPLSYYFCGPVAQSG